MSALKYLRTTPLFKNPDWQASNAAGLDEFFPKIDPGVMPAGSLLLVQIRTPKTKSRHGIIMVNESKEIEEWNTQIGRLVAIGPLAFRNRTSGKLWKEGAWAKVGDFIRVARWGGDRWRAPIPGRPDEKAMFLIANDLDMVGLVTGDPLDITAHNLNI